MASCARYVDAHLFQRADFVQQRGGIDYHAVADDRLHPGAQDAAGNQFEDELPLADEDGMAGVVATLVARNDIEVFGEEIDNLPFPLVAPLGAKHNDVSHLGVDT